MRIRTLIFLVLLSLLTACATPYKPYGSLGGYLDKEISPGTYIVEYHGNGYITHEKIEVFLHQRAGELCGGRYEIGPIDRTSKLERNPNAIWIVHRFPVVSAEVKCEKGTEFKSNHDAQSRGSAYIINRPELGLSSSPLKTTKGWARLIFSTPYLQRSATALRYRANESVQWFYERHGFGFSAMIPLRLSLSE